MPIDAKRIRDDFRRQSKFLGFLARKVRDAEEWNQGRWAEIIALIHQLLLRRHETIESAWERLQDSRGKEQAAPAVPLHLREQENLLVRGLNLLESGSNRQAFQDLRKVHAANLWWRARSLQLLLSRHPGQSAACSAFQRVAAAEMAKLGDVEIRPLESDLELARRYAATEPTLGEERERRILAIYRPREAAVEPSRRRGRRELGDGDEASSRETPEAAIGEISFTAPPSEPTLETVRRTPHMDLQPDAAIAPGAEFQVEIFADTEEARPGERVEDIAIHAPSDVKEFLLDVWLFASPHFEVRRRPPGWLRIHREEAGSNRLSFTLRARTRDELEAMRDQLPAFHKGSVTAGFSYQGRPCGRVGRVVALDLPEEPAPGLEAGAANRALVPKPAAALEFRHGERQPDMLVQVAEDEINDGRSYHCKITTALESTASAWRLDGTTWQIMSAYMANFTKSGKSSAQLVAALSGAGIEMFDASPDNFKAAFWRLIDAGQPPKTIQIVTEEPHFLWELMVPTRGAEEREPLGVEFTVGRWVTGNATSPNPLVPVSDSYVVAPVYPGRKRLEHAESESRMICEKFNGEAIQPAVYDSIRAKLLAKKVSLLHFACHGKAQDNNIMQVLELADDGELTATELKGDRAFRSYFREKQPLVFLNACEVGRQLTSLTGAGGFPAVMIGLGARAVIAPAWSVKDTIAHEIAVDFYTRLETHPEKPLAEVFQEIRKRAYEKGEDTYAAYCFYGSPLAVRQ